MNVKGFITPTASIAHPWNGLGVRINTKLTWKHHVSRPGLTLSLFGEKKTLRSSQDSNLGPLNSGQMLLPMSYWSSGIGAEDRWQEKCFRMAPVNEGSDGTYKVAAAILPSSLVAAQSSSVLILQSSPSLREIQPENRTVSMDKCHLSSAPSQSSSSSLVRASDLNSEDPGSNPGWISMSFFHHQITLQIKIPFNCPCLSPS